MAPCNPRLDTLGQILGGLEESDASRMPFTLHGEPIKDVAFVFEHSYKARPKLPSLFRTHKPLCITYEDKTIPGSR